MEADTGAQIELVAAPVPELRVPTLDEHQQRVVDHPGGPLLVLAGPGTGKTTTLVEAIVDRVQRRGADPSEVLALTFSRKAAEELSDRVTARLGRTLGSQPCATFHSFAYSIIRQFSPTDLYRAPLRLLSAPEQDVLLREILDGQGVALWPDELRAAWATRGFAREVAAVLARARERGLDPTDLAALADEAGEPAWRAAAVFMQRYLVLLDDLSAIDYPDLISRAVQIATEHRDQLRSRHRHVFVDEYQDTDPSQVALLQVLAGDGGDLVAVGDPHQSIYAFRGAEVRGILDFPRQFGHQDGSPADTVVLRTARRFGTNLLLASQRVSRRIPLTGSIPEDRAAEFLNPQSDPSAVPGKAEVVTFETERAEAEHIADRLRRAHLEDGIDFAEMAVLVRSGRASIPGLRRALSAAQVPVEVAADDTPLTREPAVATLLEALRAAIHLDNSEPSEPGYLHSDQAHALLQSPLVGLDATDVRFLARGLRRAELRLAPAQGRSARGSGELIREAVRDPDALGALTDSRPAQRVRRFARLLRSAHRQILDGASAEQVLWTLWDGTEWRSRLRRSALSGGPAARLAHRDLDALCALFETAAKVEEQRSGTSVQVFLDTLTAQQIPADTLADRGVRGSAVRLLTAHRSKGLEWQFVIVAHAQEGAWPDLRRRSSLLGADRIGSDGVLPAGSVAAMLAEERRLFYVAITRAKQRLLITAVKSPDDDGDQPSRFLAEAAGPLLVQHESRRPERPLSLAGMVAALRRTLNDPDAPESLRQAAAVRLARLASLQADGRALVPQADPGNWWGTRARTSSEQPLREPDRPIRLSPSSLESMLTCSLKWFLEREAGGAMGSTSSQGIGKLVHAIADRLGRGDITVGPDVIDELMAQVDVVWDEMSFPTPWAPARERVTLRASLVRLLAWHAAERGRRLLATEQDLSATVDLPNGERVTIAGRADRLELDDQDRAVVVDFKTGKSAPQVAAVADHPQLGLYQLAIEHGAADDVVADLMAERETDWVGPVRSGGAELVQLRATTHTDATVQHQQPLSATEDGADWILDRLEQAVEMVRQERFTATPGGHCSHCGFATLCPAKTPQRVL